MSPPPSATDLSLTRITDVHIHIQPWRELKPPVLEVMWRGKEVERDRMIQIMDDPRALLEVMDRANAFAAKYAQADRERMKLVAVVTPARALGKEPVVVQDSPAFASSRLGRGFTAGGSACLPSADRGLPSLRSPPSRCAMGTSPVIVRPQPVRRRLPDAPSARDAELAEAIRRGEAFTLVHVQELSYREAAEVMGIAPQTVANQVAAALAQLRCELKQLIADPTDVS